MPTPFILTSWVVPHLKICLIFMLCSTSESFYRKPYVAKPSTVDPLIPPKPPSKPKPRQPIKTSGSQTVPPDVVIGGRNNRYNTGWGALFNIWLWNDVKPVSESYAKWEFKTTTVPSVEVVEWFTESYSASWGNVIRAYDDKKDEAAKKESGQDWTCFSWHKTCVEDNYLRERLIRDMKYTGKMRSIGGGTDGTDNTIIAFIVIAVLIGASIGGAVFYQRKNAASLAEEEDEGAPDDDEEIKKEPLEEPEAAEDDNEQK